MNKSNKYSPEVRERAVRLVQEARKDYPSQWAAVESIAPKIGCAAVTLHEWVKKHEVDSGIRDGVPSAERERIKALEREVKELRQTPMIQSAPEENRNFHPRRVRSIMVMDLRQGCAPALGAYE